MNFSDLLDLHESFAPKGSHPEILGDGFLMESNPIYRKVRTFANQIGCTLIEAYPEYLLLPFQELPNIVASKRVPFVPSARLMRKVENDHPGVFTVQDMPMPESYHLHESAHVIADHFLRDIKAGSAEEQILKSMLAESFANTVDALTCIKATDDLNFFFIKQNSYMTPQKKVSRAMENLIGKMGFKFVFMLTYFTYLQSNFLARPLTKKAVRELADKHDSGVKITSALQKDIDTVVAIGEKLDPLFRITTTGNYLKQMGLAGNIHDLLDFPFTEMIKRDPKLNSAVESLSKVLE